MKRALDVGSNTDRFDLVVGRLGQEALEHVEPARLPPLENPARLRSRLDPDRPRSLPSRMPRGTGAVATGKPGSAARPEVRNSLGPHGIPLRAHAKAGGEQARSVLELFDSKI